MIIVGLVAACGRSDTGDDPGRPTPARSMPWYTIDIDYDEGVPAVRVGEMREPITINALVRGPAGRARITSIRTLDDPVLDSIVRARILAFSPPDRVSFTERDTIGITVQVFSLPDYLGPDGKPSAYASIYEEWQFPEGDQPSVDQDELMASVNYPRIPRHVDYTAMVVLRVVVEEDGSAGSVEVLSSDDERFTRAAVDAARNATYTPGRIDGKPVVSALTVQLQFKN